MMSVPAKDDFGLDSLRHRSRPDLKPSRAAGLRDAERLDRRLVFIGATWAWTDMSPVTGSV